MIKTLTATIFITDKCNLACKYCYEANKEAKSNTVENIDKFLNYIYTDKRYNDFDGIILDFIGGEALLDVELMEYAMNKFLIIGKALNHKWLSRFTFFVSTNGTLFTDPKIKSFLDRWPCLHVGVSLDGNKEAHDRNRVYLDGSGSYDKIMETFDWWKNKYNENMVKGTFDKNTLPLLSNMLINQAKLGMTKLWANPIYEYDWTKEDAELYKNELIKVVHWVFDNNNEFSIEALGRPKRVASNIRQSENKDFHYCGTGLYMITLGMDGNLYPCHRFATSSNHKYPIGNVDTGIDDLLLNTFKVGLSAIDDGYKDSFDPICYSSYYDREGKFINYNAVNEMVKAEEATREEWNNCIKLKYVL